MSLSAEKITFKAEDGEVSVATLLALEDKLAAARETAIDEAIARIDTVLETTRVRKRAHMRADAAFYRIAPGL